MHKLMMGYVSYLRHDLAVFTKQHSSPEGGGPGVTPCESHGIRKTDMDRGSVMSIPEWRGGTVDFHVYFWGGGRIQGLLHRESEDT